MTDIIDLVRPEIRQLSPYQPAQWDPDAIRLSANESPWPPPGDDSAPGLNRYPEPRPDALTQAMAAHYGVAFEQLLVTRGSSDAIDLVLRCFCRPGQDDIVICPPTFGMYGIYAQIQGAGIREIPLLNDHGFELDPASIRVQWDTRAKVLFLCSPNNPTGNRFTDGVLHELCEFLSGRAIVVVDGAYTEFSGHDPMTELLARHDNVIVLRTLSKAFGLAGIRCGALLADPAVVGMMNRIQPPFCYPTPSLDPAMACLAPEFRPVLDERMKRLRDLRSDLAEALADLPDVRRVWPSETNFLLVQVGDASAFVRKARSGGVSIRDFSWERGLAHCVRITVGTGKQNGRLIEALSQD